MTGKNIVSHMDIQKKQATVFPGEALSSRVRTPFTISYDADIDMRELDLSIIMTPFLLNIVPLLWFLGGIWKIDCMDEDLYSSLNIVKEGFRKLYPQFPWSGELIPDHLTGRSIRESSSSYDQILFFSGGVDSTYSALKADPSRTVLLTIRGHDIAIDNDKAWHEVLNQVHRFASSFHFNSTTVTANVFGLLRCGDIHKKHPELKPWYGMVQHGLGLAGLAFPLAAYNGMKKVLFSSSESIKAKRVCPFGSHYLLEPHLRVAGIEVISTGKEIFWPEKVAEMVDFFRNHPQLKKPLFRVCLSDMKGDATYNCGKCEKCLRGIISLISQSEDPSEWGFNLEGKPLETIPPLLRKIEIKDEHRNYWERIHALAIRGLVSSSVSEKAFLSWFSNWLEDMFISSPSSKDESSTTLYKITD